MSGGKSYPDLERKVKHHDHSRGRPQRRHRFAGRCVPPDGLEVRVEVKGATKRDWDIFFRHCVGIAEDEPQVSRNIHDYMVRAVEEHARATKSVRLQR